MDDLACDGEVVFQTLRELDVINRWLGGNAVTLQATRKIWKNIPVHQPITIADLGCGSGEMLRIISALAEKENRKVKLIGFDANPHIIEYARSHSTKYPTVFFETINVFSEAFQKQKFDLVLATLFLHHFSEAELITLFSSLKKQSRLAIIVNDIHRHPLAYHSIRILTRLFSRSAMVKFDAPLSVMRAFKKNELIEVLKKAGIENYKLKWKWAFRWQLIID
jgi:2-polyprenyl-3-methyl-5-hydroxy-6-metoxy-1,4-benzoquinol methylase